MKIHLEQIKLALCKAIDDYALMHGGEPIELDKDYYWKIADSQLFYIAHKPDDFEIGSFSDEVSQLSESMERGDILGAVSLQHLACLLLWLSAKAGESPTKGEEEKAR